MKIKVIGCGGAFTEELYHQCFMLTENGKNLFIDMGQQILPFAFKNAGLTVKDVDAVIITHGHDDHMLSLGTLGFKRYDWVNRPKHYTEAPKPYAPKLIANEDLMDEIWNATSINFKTMEGFVATLETFFQPVRLKGNEHYNFEGWDLQLVQQIHVMTGSMVMNSFGVFGERDDSSFFVTSDTQFFQPRQVRYFYDRAKLIITDCETVGTNLKFPEGTKYYTEDGKDIAWPTPESDPDGMKGMELLARGVEQKTWASLKYMSGVHSTYPELAGYPSANATVLPPEMRKKIWLSHYGDHVIHGKDAFGNPVDWDALAAKDGFAGFVKLGQVFEV